MEGLKANQSTVEVMQSQVDRREAQNVIENQIGSNGNNASEDMVMDDENKHAANDYGDHQNQIISANSDLIMNETNKKQSTNSEIISTDNSVKEIIFAQKIIGIGDLENNGTCTNPEQQQTDKPKDDGDITVHKESLIISKTIVATGNEQTVKQSVEETTDKASADITDQISSNANTDALTEAGDVGTVETVSVGGEDASVITVTGTVPDVDGVLMEYRQEAAGSSDSSPDSSDEEEDAQASSQQNTDAQINRFVESIYKFKNKNRSGYSVLLYLVQKLRWIPSGMSG